METHQVKVGIGVMVMKDGKILVGKRKSNHAGGEYALPGGRMEYMESFEGCARREVREETGMEIENIQFLRLWNMKSYPPQHHIGIVLMADWKNGEPQLMEPDKCEGWGWYGIDEVPTPTFKGLKLAIDSYKTGKNFFDE